jgi:hypothetical protein
MAVGLQASAAQETIQITIENYSPVSKKQNALSTVPFVASPTLVMGMKEMFQKKAGHHKKRSCIFQNANVYTSLTTTSAHKV